MDAVILVYLVLNAAALIMFGLDKGMAVAGRRRFRERTLLLASLFGPYGAYSGMKLFHHKTRQLKFKLVPFFLVLHSALIIYLLTYGARLP